MPVAASPGRGGFGPRLTLTYDSGAGNGPFGLGWSVGLPSITRKTQRGLPRYEDASESDTFVLAGAEDLVPALRTDGTRDVVTDRAYTGDGRYVVHRYRPRVEGLFARIERWVRGSDQDTHWRVITGDNLTSVYGATAASRIVDPGGTKVFQWLIERTYDDKGNIVVYEYKPEDDAGIDPRLPQERGRLRDRSALTQKYVKCVRYGNSRPYLVHLNREGRAGFDSGAWDRDNRWHYELVFDYGEHDPTDPSPGERSDWPVRRDPFSTHRPGFEVRTYRLCRRILMFHRFEELGSAPRLVRSTLFGYDGDEENPGNPIATQLLEVAHASHEEGMPPALTPGVRFRYSRAELREDVRHATSDEIHQLPDGRNSQWLDLEGEGLSGVLARHDGGWLYQRNEGDGRFAAPALMATVPAAAAAGPHALELVDLTGNGRTDAVVWSAGVAGAHELAADSRWQSFVPFRHVPNVDRAQPQLRLVDLTGDGQPDLLITEGDRLSWHQSEGAAGYGPARAAARVLDEDRGPAVVFADGTQTIFVADMSGDGLLDIVRVRNGEVCYWPNTGYGTFGAKVTMDGAPFFDEPSAFDPRLVRLGDIDGTGTADIFYLGGSALRYWHNHAGNGWSEERSLASFPRVDAGASVQVIDLLGHGTACLVWTSGLPADEAIPIRYLPLMSDGKPYLLTEVDDGMGAVTRVAYAPSTRYSIDDRRNGRPWVTRLPFPVHVVERVETVDAIGGNRFTSLYAYHHGFFDGEEREFRGFGLVETWDTEQPLERGSASNLPPVHTRSWYHTGSFLERQRISRLYEDEYYRGDGEAWLLPDTPLPAGLAAEEVPEACRALKGRMLRQEVYGLDDTEDRVHPYTVVEKNYDVHLEQPRAGAPHAVFSVCDRETLTCNYERDPADPRIAHAVTLETDRYGKVRRSAIVAYPRRRAPLPEQARMHVTVAENDFIHLDDSAWTFRTGLPAERRTYEIRGASRAGLWTREDLVLAAGAPLAAFTAPPPGASGSIDRRLLARSRVRYYRDTLDPAIPLPFGQAEPLGLPHEEFTLVFTQDILDRPELGGRITPALLREGGYRNDVDEDPGHWWRPSGLLLFDTTRAPSMFYLPRGARDPFGAESTIAYDEPRFLFPAAVTDAAGNVVAAEHDYRVLAPFLVTDANGNRSQVVFDTRGMVVATAIMGKAGETDPRAMGDDLAGFERFGAETDPRGLPRAESGAILGDPRRYLQRASTFFHYDVFAWRRDGTPPLALSVAREVHAADEGDTPSPLQVSLAYFDGFGRPIQTKVQAEDGPAPVYDAAGTLIVAATPVHSSDRWVGTGATVFNNKGLPVRKYEPFFDSRPDFTREEALVHIGAAATLDYDPLGRVIRTVHADGSLSRMTFDPWRQVTHDANDTVTESDWYRARMGDAAAPAERAAADKAAAHRDTPVRLSLDTLGRPFVSVAHNKRRVAQSDGTFRLEDEFIPSRTDLDAEGNPLAIYDGRGCEGLALDEAVRHAGNTVATSIYAMGGLPLFSESMDAGRRWTLVNVAGKPSHTWDQRDDHGDGRGHHRHTLYDRLQRPTRVRVDVPAEDGGTATMTVQLLVYGDDLPREEARRANLRGKPHLHFDGAGLVENVAYDFKGNLLEGSRRLAEDQGVPDWASLEGMPPRAMRASPLLRRERFSAASEYDAFDRARAVTTPDGSVQRSGYNKAKLLETVEVHVAGAPEPRPLVTQIDYNARGQRTFIRYGNGLETTYTYDPRTFRLVRLESRRGAEAFQDLHYVHDAAGNITQVRDDAIEPIFFHNESVEAESRYTYDALYRLVEATGRESAASAAGTSYEPIPRLDRIPAHDRALRNYTEHYHYDPAGNLLRLQHVARDGAWTRQYHYHPDSNRLRATGDESEPERIDLYRHDGNGNLRSLPHLQHMFWDHGDHLERVVIAGRSEVWFHSDAEGQRVRKVRVADGTRTERVYLGGLELYREYLGVDEEPSYALATLHVRAGGERVCMVETPAGERETAVPAPAPRFRFQLGTITGSATVELDQDGQVITYEEYHPYGTTAYHARNGTITVSAKRYRHTGMERDEETGLDSHGARYYAAWLGRWTSADPAGLVDGPNVYAYVGNAPVGRSDPSGRSYFDREPVSDLGESGEGDVIERAGHGQLRPYGQFRPDRQPVVIVHGANSNPEELRSIIARYEDNPHYQIYVFFYDDQGQFVDTSGNDLAQGLSELRTQYLAKFTDRPVVQIVAHSMGGLVARAAMNSLADPNWRPASLRRGARDRPLQGATASRYGGINLVAIDSPWQGSGASEMTMRDVPRDEPSWVDMMATSTITQTVSAPPLPSNFTFNEIEAYGGGPTTGWAEIGDSEAQAMIRYFGQGDAAFDHNGYLVNMARALYAEEDFRALYDEVQTLARSGSLTPDQLRGLFSHAVERVGGPGDLVGHSQILRDPRLLEHLDRWLFRHLPVP